MTENFKLIIEYDGTGYHGWQRQPNDKTIQQEIESALEKMTRSRIILTGSGRTDAGVHALGQVANFKCATRISAEAFQNGLNSLLPPDIVIRECAPVSPAFHSRFDAKSKIYRYRIRNHPLPAAIGRNYTWWIRAPLDIDAMQSALALLSGEHDFKAFEASGSPRAHTVRTLRRADVVAESPELLSFFLEADGFLRCMVRNIVGTVVQVGMGKMRPIEIEKILTSRDRGLAGATAPPQGLCLMKVIYG